MSGGWNNSYGTPAQNYGQRLPPIQQLSSQNHQTPTGAISTINGAESIMGMYPPASITPITHVARHLAVPSAPIPSFIQSTSSSLRGALNYPPRPNHQEYRPPPPAQYNVLPERVTPLASSQVPDPGSQQRQFWDHHQRQASRLLEQQRAEYDGQSQQQQQQRHSQYGNQGHSRQGNGYAAPPSWAPSEYQPPPFGASVLQSGGYTSSASSRPQSWNAPPPPAPVQLPPLRMGGTPSSLSNALVDPTQSRQHHQHPPSHTQHPQPQQQQFSSWQSQNTLPPFQSQQPRNSYPHPSQPHSQQRDSLPAPVAPPQAQGPPPPRYTPNESKPFFDDFLEKTMQKVNTQAPLSSLPQRKQQQQQQPWQQRPPERVNGAQSHSTPRAPSMAAGQAPRAITQPQPQSRAQQYSLPPRPKTPPRPLAPSNVPPEESPDPLAAMEFLPQQLRVSLITPQKRKSDEPLVSPTAKRLQLREGPIPMQQSSKPSSKASGTPMSVSPKKRMDVYVAVPPLPKNWTPGKSSAGSAKKNTSRMEGSDTPDPLYRGRTGSVFSDVTKAEDASEDEMALGSNAKLQPSSLRGSGIRTGERDDRVPLQKLTELISDVFEAEDEFSPDAEEQRGKERSNFISDLMPDTPLLSMSAMHKLKKAIEAVAHPSRRHRVPSRESSKAVVGLVAMDEQTLQRLLKSFGCSIGIGLDLEPFAGPPAAATSNDAKPASKSKKKAPKKKPNSTDAKRAKSKTPMGDADGDQEMEDAGEAGAEITFEDVEKLDRQLRMAKESLVAVDVALTLLTADHLPKQLYREELISDCLNATKTQLENIVYPVTESLNETRERPTAILQHVIHSDDPVVQVCRSFIGEVFQTIKALLPRLNALLSRTDLSMSESIVIQATYIAIGPFFSVDFGADQRSSKGSAVLSAMGGGSALRGLRLESLALIRSIFAYYPGQRQGIIEDILSSLLQVPNLKSKSGQFRLRDGRSIHTISALLLQLVQTSAHDVAIDGRKFLEERRQLISQLNVQDASDVFLNDRDKQELETYSTALKSSNTAAGIIIQFLTTRTSKGKIAKSTQESDYRAIFDHLMQDLLTVLFKPEWPAAGVLLLISTKYMMSALEDVKASSNDTNGAKSMALDHLGVIGSQLRANILKYRQGEDASEALISLDDIIAKADAQALDRLISAYEDLLGQLVKRAKGDQLYESARELTAAMWGQDLSRAVQRCDSLLNQMATAGEQGTSEYSVLQQIATRAKSSLQNLWYETDVNVFDAGTEADMSRVDGVSLELGTLHRLTSFNDAMLNVILNALGSNVVFMRTKGLKALGQIMNVDPDILTKANVRNAVENHLHDQSPAVRDAAVELIGRHVVTNKELATAYYSVLADRIADTGVSVRKRIIKLLKVLYEAADDQVERRIDICAKLVSRMADDDDGVKDLAAKTLEDLWLGDFSSQPIVRASSIEDGIAPAHWSAEDRAKSTALVIMGVASKFADRQSPLEDLFHQIVSSKEAKDASIVLARYKDIGDALISSLVDAQLEPGFNLISCIKTVHLLVAAHPRMLSLANVRNLLPYLKNASTKEDQAIADFILKIYSTCIPHLPKTAITFAQELQGVLALRIQKPSNPTVLPESIACFCNVIKHLTHDYKRVVGLLKSCNGRVQAIAQGSNTLTPQNLRALIIIVLMISLLCENCDFDALRIENEDLAVDINGVSKGSIIDHVYGLLLSLYEKFPDPAARGPFLRCLGNLFRAKPTLMTQPESASTMDAVFLSDDEDAKGRLLKIMQGFLVAESEKHAVLLKAKGSKAAAAAINMDELVGNTGDFAESGVSSAVVQRYLPQILEAALNVQPRIQAVAVDILGFTIRQGLAHPLQCLPVIVALETSPNNNLSSRATGLHSILYSKHASLMNTQYLDCARRSFDYQRSRSSEVQGYRLDPAPAALLHPWYSLVREKRTTRQDFLKAILKCFDLDSTDLRATQDDMDFIRYMAENLSAFDYKTQEEVFTVIKHLTSVLSVAGIAVLGTWSPTTSLVEGSQMPPDESSIPAVDMSYLPFARASVTVGMLLILKAYLKLAYGLSEDKCAKWIPGKKSAVGDKAATRGNPQLALSWERMPYAMRPIVVPDDIMQQRSHFLTLWEEDGVQPEPEDFDAE